MQDSTIPFSTVPAGAGVCVDVPEYFHQRRLRRSKGRALDMSAGLFQVITGVTLSTLIVTFFDELV